MSVLEFAVFLCFPAALAMAAAMDLFTMTIPNRISLALIVTFAIAAPLSGLGLAAIGSHLAAGLLMLVIGFFMFARGWLGGGDAKLLAAASLWIGLDWLLPYLLYVTVAGGLLVIGLLLYRALSLPGFLYQQGWAVRLHQKTCGIPYGIALAAGGLFVYPKTVWFTTLAV
jgi:prepilin peptidase CpaA